MYDLINLYFYFSVKNHHYLRNHPSCEIMRARERLSCGVGNVFNDLYRQLLMSFEILFFMHVVQLSASQAGLIVLIGQIADATISPLTGYLGDRVNVPLLSSRIGRRKSWHLVATAIMMSSFPLFINRCFLCDTKDQSWLPLVYFGFLSAVTNLCYNMVEINHLAFISTVTEKVEECTALRAVRFAIYSALCLILSDTQLWHKGLNVFLYNNLRK